ncbi:MAG: 1-(5-phosphoribosyl)-5-[(5-phosphoribosylamino)methylideneamino] imidazole-4-carboxamide isomerase [Synergistaceae bacterium]|jgi:phosphoribosylformimino-5-aminoimidazole carboxamide ribotide isomerase|nr:1-(5-phosphoribosyl)-5-[(5-phosphoribosylamino)methylideneamino] imidazole-4-carboxamide isomerase [Synergistaceae bacterium]
MIVLPAIDLYDGKVVRLSKGDFSKKTEYGTDALEAARAYAGLGCTNLHVVDLEGAESGSPKHLRVLRKIVNLGLEIEYGGGLRERSAIRDVLSAGAARAILGSLLFKSEDAAGAIFEEFGNSVLPAIDVRDGKVAVFGWAESTGYAPESCLDRLSAVGFKRFLVTSADRDGMLAGPDMELIGSLIRAPLEIIAAGGVTTLDDIKKLKAAGAFGAVVGKALYESGFDLAAALEIAEDAR